MTQNPPQNLLTLTRQTLYDLVWSKPMSQLANDFGISDVGLAKRCRAVDVPIPYRGYWARVAAGQSPHKLPLPKYRTTSSPASAASPAMRTGPKEIPRAGPEPQVRFGQPAERPAEPQTPGALMAEAFQQRVTGLKVSAATSLCDTCAAVRRTASFHKLPGRGALKLKHDETSGPIIDVEVSTEVLERALFFADRLIRTAEGLGWTLEALTPPKEAPVQRSRWERAPTPEVPKPLLALLRVEGEPMVFRIEERLRREPRVPTPAELAREKREYFYHAPRTQDVSTGKLRVIRLQTENYWGPERKTWFDRGGKNPVECQIPNILYGFFEGALELQEKRAEREREAQRQAELERHRQDRRERRAAQDHLKATLERQAGAWYRARLLRRYVQAARRKLADGHRIEAEFREQSIDFLEWATDYIEQLDPLSTRPLEPDQWPELSRYSSADESGFHRMVYRMTGLDGLPAEKPFIDETDPSNTCGEGIADDFDDDLDDLEDDY